MTVELSGEEHRAITAHAGHRSSHQAVSATSTHDKRVDRKGGLWQAGNGGKSLNLWRGSGVEDGNPALAAPERGTRFVFFKTRVYWPAGGAGAFLGVER